LRVYEGRGGAFFGDNPTPVTRSRKARRERPFPGEPGDVSPRFLRSSLLGWWNRPVGVQPSGCFRKTSHGNQQDKLKLELQRLNSPIQTTKLRLALKKAGRSLPSRLRAAEHPPRRNSRWSGPAYRRGISRFGVAPVTHKRGDAKPYAPPPSRWTRFRGVVAHDERNRGLTSPARLEITPNASHPKRYS